MSEGLTKKWIGFYNSLQAINQLKIPRWLHTTKGDEIEFYGFADASEMGYGAVIYVRCEKENEVKMNLLTSKTRVAPVKQMSIPRLELCACELLANLMQKVRQACDKQNTRYYMFSDSKVALAWIANSPANLKPYVSNRVAAIQEKSDRTVWKYIGSKNNPADMASRGIKPSELVRNSERANLWWHGPTGIRENKESFNKNTMSSEEKISMSEECKQTFSIATCVNQNSWLTVNGVPLINKYNSLSKTVRVTAYVFASIDKMRRRNGPTKGCMGRLTKRQLVEAINYWILYTQLGHYTKEYNKLERKEQIEKSSKLRTIAPFIGTDQLMRVRGRIENAPIPYDERCPIIVPNHSKLQKLLLQEAHQLTLHGNIQKMLHYTNRRFWIMGAKSAAKATVKTCVRCQMLTANDRQQLMSALPKERLTPARPFFYCGVDYFGPIQVKRFDGRCRTIDKGYGVVFICMTTKMVHIECVSNLTTERFLWALSRLAAVYQLPNKLFSDNAKTFKGAENELRMIREAWLSKEVEEFLTTQGTQWQFIAPKAPFQGGIWEAAVKSTKYHMRRLLSNEALTFEQYQTLFAKITAVLNSRPLVMLSDNPTELNYLTPSHAMIGERVVQPLAEDLSELPMSRLKQYKIIEKIHQDFWKTWRRDYIGTLQNRYKWNQKEKSLQVGDLVVMKENMPPGTWPIARVIKVYKTSGDDVVYNVKIRTSKSDLVRSVRTLAKLKLEEETNEDKEENIQESIK